MLHPPRELKRFPLRLARRTPQGRELRAPSVLSRP
jgi:hypothetical protein